MDDSLELTEAKIFQNLVVQLKNRFSQKVTKFEINLPLHNKWEIFSNFVTLSQYCNFTFLPPWFCHPCIFIRFFEITSLKSKKHNNFIVRHTAYFNCNGIIALLNC